MDLESILKGSTINDFVNSYFSGNFKLFIEFLSKKNLLGDVEDELIEDGYFYDVMKHHYENEPQYVIDYVVDNYFGDVKYEGNKYWLTIDRDDLAGLFDTDRWGGGAYNIARKVLSDNYEEFYDYVEIHDLEDDVISNLDANNLNYLKEAVYKEVEGKEVDIDGELDIVTRDYVMNMNESELSKFIEKNTPETRMELGSLYNSSYEYAFESEVYDLVMDELKGFFGVDNFSREVPYKRKTYKAGTTEPIEVNDYLYQVDVSNILPTIILDVINMNGYNSDNDFEYYGELEGVMKFWLREQGDLLRFYIPDYADDSLVNKNLNEMLKDYI